MEACHAAAAIRRDGDGPGFTPRKMYLTKISRPGAASKHLPAGKRGHFEARNFGHTEVGGAEKESGEKSVARAQKC